MSYKINGNDIHTYFIRKTTFANEIVYDQPVSNYKISGNFWLYTEIGGFYEETLSIDLFHYFVRKGTRSNLIYQNTGFSSILSTGSTSIDIFNYLELNFIDTSLTTVSGYSVTPIDNGMIIKITQANNQKIAFNFSVNYLDWLVVGGGGGGGSTNGGGGGDSNRNAGGGGGGGQVGFVSLGVAVVKDFNSITIGNGGRGAYSIFTTTPESSGIQGGDTTISYKSAVNVVCKGGGGGGSGKGSSPNTNGGSSGGTGSYSSGKPSIGNITTTAINNVVFKASKGENGNQQNNESGGGGGGGGAGGGGEFGGGAGGGGGPGYTWNGITVGGGGGGGADQYSYFGSGTLNGGEGGSGGGGRGGYDSQPPLAGTANTGGGGGGSPNGQGNSPSATILNGNGAGGGSGVIYIKILQSYVVL